MVAELVRSMLQRRKMGADAAKVITDAATVLLAPLQARIKELEHIVDELRLELINAKEEVHQARLVINALERRLGLGPLEEEHP